MLELVIAVVVALVVGLLIGITSMNGKVRLAEQRLEIVSNKFDEFTDTAYSDVNYQINLLRCNVFPPMAELTNTQRKRLRRLGSQLLRIKDKDEDHPDSVERQ